MQSLLYVGRIRRMTAFMVHVWEISIQILGESWWAISVHCRMNAQDTTCNRSTGTTEVQSTCNDIDCTGVHYSLDFSRKPMLMLIPIPMAMPIHSLHSLHPLHKPILGCKVHCQLRCSKHGKTFNATKGNLLNHLRI